MKWTDFHLSSFWQSQSSLFPFWIRDFFQPVRQHSVDEHFWPELGKGPNFSGPGSGFKIKFFFESKKPEWKISGPGRPARCRALFLTLTWRKKNSQSYRPSSRYDESSGTFCIIVKIKSNKIRYTVVSLNF